MPSQVAPPASLTASLSQLSSVARPLWLEPLLWEVGGGRRSHLKGPGWQQCPVKPASLQPPALNSLEAAIPPVFSPFSMFGHSCSFKTVPLSLLQVVAGRSQRAPKGLADAEPDSGLRRWVLGQMEVPVDATPLSEPPAPSHSSREGFVRTMKRGTEGAPCPQLTQVAPLPQAKQRKG